MLCHIRSIFGWKPERVCIRVFQFSMDSLLGSLVMSKSLDSAISSVQSASIPDSIKALLEKIQNRLVRVL